MTGYKTEDIPFRTVDGIELLGRLYRPETGGATTWVVETHGGAWGSGDRLNNAHFHEVLAGAGVGVFALDFRSSAQVKYPGPVEDANAGARWLKANANRLGIEVRRFGGLGTSSGGQMMGMLAFRPDDPLYAAKDSGLEGVSAALDFFVACWPILDPLARYRMAQSTGKERLVAAHNAYFADEKAMEQGNPYMLIERGEASHMPPMTIIQGTDDGNVEHTRADMFAELYRSKGGSVAVHKFEGAPHSFVSADPDSDRARKALATVRDFVLAQAG